MRVRDLGPLEIETEPTAANPSGRVAQRIVGGKQIALLSLLCLRLNARVSLDELRLAGWGEDAVVAGATIENHMWRLRRAMEPARVEGTCLVSDSGGYRLILPPTTVDSAQFELLGSQARALAQRGDYAAALNTCDTALGLWREDPFATVSHVPGLESLIARLHELRTQLCEWRIDALLALADAGQALLDVNGLIRANPYRERLWAQKMTALTRLGRNEEALTTYQRARELLSEELGLEPGSELRDLQRAILDQDAPRLAEPTTSGAHTGRDVSAVHPTATNSRPPSWMKTRWPLAGRTTVLYTLRHALIESTVIILRGDAGVGKSRMLEEALREAHASGTHVKHVVATRAGSTIPLGVFADSLPIGARVDDPLRMMQHIQAALNTEAAGKRLVLGIDDAQLLDGPSAALILHLAHSGVAAVIATIRTGEPVNDAIDALQRRPDGVHIDLPPLTDTEVSTLVDAILGNPADSAVHRWVQRSTRGNAFYAVELIRSARADRQLRLNDGIWQLIDAPPVPDSLAESVQRTLNGLDEPARKALDILALAEPLRPADLSQLGYLGAVIDLESEGLVMMEGEGRDAKVVTAHPLYAAVLKALLPPLRARSIRGALIELFARRGDLAPEDQLRLVRWQLESGETLDSQTLTSAARIALELNDPALALELSTIAIAETTDIHGDRRGPVDARLCQARAHILRREYTAAANALADMQPSLHTQKQALLYLQAQNEISQWGLARPEDFRALLDYAVGWWADAEWQSRLTTLTHRFTVFERLAEQSQFAIGTGSEPMVELVSAQIGSLFYSGESGAALALCRQTETEPPFTTLEQAICAALDARVELERGDALSGLEVRLTRLRDRGLDVDDPAAVGLALYMLSELRMLQVNPSAALALLAEAERFLDRRDPTALRGAVLAGLVIASHQVGNLDLMRSALSRMRQMVGERPAAHLLPYTARAEAEVQMADGDQARAVTTLRQAGNTLKDSPIHRGRLAYDAMLVGAPTAEMLPIIEKAAAHCDAPLVMFYAAHARARLTHDDSALTSIARKLEEDGLLAYRARVLIDIADNQLGIDS